MDAPKSQVSKQTNEIPPSKFNPSRDQEQIIDMQNIGRNNNKFWEQQSVSLHKCYKQGQAFANNSTKKTAIDLLQDMFILLKQQYKDNSEHQQHFETIFTQINSNLQLIDDMGNSVDKNCILSIIQGYTLGCLQRYEKDSN